MVPAMTLEGVSFWYGARLGTGCGWSTSCCGSTSSTTCSATNPGVRELAFDAGADAPLVAAARLVSERDGLTIGGEASTPLPATDAPAADPSAPAAAKPASPPRRPTSFIGRLRSRFRPPEPERRRRLVAKRLNAIAAEPAGRLLVVQAHVAPARRHGGRPTVHQPVPRPGARSPAGRPPRPVRGRPAHDDGGYRRAVGVDRVPRSAPQPPDRRGQHAWRQDDGHGQTAVTRRVPARTGSSPSGAPLEVSGIDLGPDLARIVADRAGTLARRIVDVERDSRAAAPDARGRDPARRRVPPPGLAGRRRRRGGPGRGRPARRDLTAAHGLHPPHPAAGAAARPVGPTCSGLGAGRADPYQRVSVRGGGRRRVAATRPRRSRRARRPRPRATISGASWASLPATG